MAQRFPHPLLVNADLHCHSTWSDGVLSPDVLVERAASAAVGLFAITDHDEISGVAQAQARAAELSLPFLAGVEVSVSWAGETIHIVGLGVDATNAELVEGLRRTRSGRDARAAEIGRQLALVGIEGAYEGALSYAANPGLVSRTHFARFLVETGVCGDVREVFSRYLVAGKPGYVEQRWASLSEAVAWIRGAQGMAVLAHPARYRLSDLARECMFEEFKEVGGEAIEVVCGSHTPSQYEQYAKVAQRLHFMASRGSDFHSPTESHMDIGKLPPLPAYLTPIWSHELLQAQIQ